MKLCFATHNRGKLLELRAVIEAARLGLEVVTLQELGLPDDVVEDGETFVDNARIKAVAAHERTGLWALSDDSGLEVDALGGAPGVHSARYAEQPGQPRSDERNRQALLAALAGVPAERRTGRFRCVLCLRGPGEVAGEARGAAPCIEVVRDGTLAGVLLDEQRGGGGFGYDPLFVPAAADVLAIAGELAGLGLAAAGLVGRTLAELPLEVKNLLSHRARAMAAMRPVLAELAAGRGVMTGGLRDRT